MRFSQPSPKFGRLIAVVHHMPKTSCNRASAQFLEMLAAIEPSTCGEVRHYPCAVTLRDGSRAERVICVEDHRGFRQDWWVHPEDIRDIAPSPVRMPATMATQLYEAGESGMGCEIFKMRMRAGTESVFVTGNVVDFPELPPGYHSEDIECVSPHQGCEESKNGYRQGAPFKWCFYVRD